MHVCMSMHEWGLGNEEEIRGTGNRPADRKKDLYFIITSSNADRQLNKVREDRVAQMHDG